MSKQKNGSEATTLEDRIVAIAGQVGWVVGAAQARTAGWLDKARLTDQLTRIRDGASELLESLQATAEKTTAAASSGRAAFAARADDKIHAAGKKHRAPAPSQRGVRHSNQQIAKAKLSSMRKRTGNR